MDELLSVFYKLLSESTQGKWTTKPWVIDGKESESLYDLVNPEEINVAQNLYKNDANFLEFIHNKLPFLLEKEKKVFDELNKTLEHQKNNILKLLDKQKKVIQFLKVNVHQHGAGCSKNYSAWTGREYACDCGAEFHNLEINKIIKELESE